MQMGDGLRVDVDVDEDVDMSWNRTVYISRQGFFCNQLRLL